MKRDMELIRKMLFYIEDNYKPGQQWIREIKVEGYESEVITEHIRLIYEAGLIQDIEDISTLSGTCYWVGNLSNAGYDFLDKIRSDTTWIKTKEIIMSKGLPLVVETIKTVATAVISAATEGAVKGFIGGAV